MKGLEKFGKNDLFIINEHEVMSLMQEKAENIKKTVFHPEV